MTRRRLILAIVAAVLFGMGWWLSLDRLSADKQLLVATLLGLMLLGLVIGWVREGLGGLLVLLGLAAFNAVELAVNCRPAGGRVPAVRRAGRPLPAQRATGSEGLGGSWLNGYLNSGRIDTMTPRTLSP